jgi:hypothetical protein
MPARWGREELWNRFIKQRILKLRFCFARRHKILDDDTSREIFSVSIYEKFRLVKDGRFRGLVFASYMTAPFAVAVDAEVAGDT